MSRSPARVQPSSLQSPPEVSHVSKKPLVLIVDDNPGDVGLVREALSEHGVKCTVKVIHDGQKAMLFVDELDGGASFCPDLVILDLNLPRINGFKILERLRASPRCSQAAIAIVTSSDNPAEKAQAARLGATRYLLKPVGLEAFMRLGGVFKQMLADLREPGNPS